MTSLAVDDKFIVIGMNNCKIHIFDATSGTFLRTLVGHEAGGVWCLTLISAGGERKEAPPPKEEGDVDMDAGRRARKFDEGALKTDQVREPVLVGGESSPSATSRPQGLFGGLSDFSANSNPLASSSTTSLPPSFDHHFATSSSNSKLGPDGRPKMAQSDVCGASKGFGQKRTLIVSGGCDRDIRVWDAETGACIYILRGHTSTIRCLTVVEGRPLVVSGSRDSTLRVWDVEKGVLVHLLAGHQHSVRCVEVAGNQVVSGSYDCTCRVSSLPFPCWRLLEVLTSRLLIWSCLCSSGMSILESACRSSEVTTIRFTRSRSTECVWRLARSTRPSACGPQRLGASSSQNFRFSFPTIDIYVF